MEDFKKPNKLDKIEQQLYSSNREEQQKPRHQMVEEESDVPQDWVKEVNEKEENPFKKEVKTGMSMFTKIFIGALSFFVLALGYTFFILKYNGTPEANNVDISINSSVSVAAGEEFIYDIIIENNNQVEMETVDLVIEYPEGTRDGGDVSVDFPRERYTIDNISSGTYLRESRAVFLFGEEGDTKEIEVKIVYRVADSTAVFEKRKVFDVILKSTPVRMNIASIKEVTAGQDLEFDVELISNSNESIDRVMIKAEYPFGFLFDSSTLPNSINNNTWIIEKLDPKEVLKFKIKGELQGQNNEGRFFRFTAGLIDSKKESDIGVVFTSVGKSVLVSRPFLEIGLSVDGDNSSVINLNSTRSHRVIVNYKNNTSEPIRDVEIVLQLEGDVLNEGSVNPSGGFYKSLDNTIKWDKTTNPDFDQLNIGESGTVEFNFRTKDLAGGERFKNPEIAISAKVFGDRYENENVPENVINEIYKTFRFNTVASFAADSYYHNGPFTNSGLVPPKVDQETTYSIIFAVANTSNRISNAVMEMTLPNYVTFKENVWPSGTNATYDARERKITWNIGELKEESGYGEIPVQAAFQLGFMPSISQKNSSPVLVDKIRLVGNDLFTGQQIIVEGDRITTAIKDSTNYFDGQVSQ